MSKSKQGGSGRAVALQYGPGSGAPVIVASGMGHLAERIVEVAVDSGVPVYEDNSLATILSQMELGREIPEELYQAIVDIYIYFLQFDPSDPEKYRRLLRYGLITVAIMTVVCFAGIFLLAPQLVHIFLGSEKPLLNAASTGALRRYALSYLLVGFNILMGGFLTAVERPRSALCISMGRGLVLQAGALLLLAALWGGSSIWFAPLCSELLCFAMALILMRRFRRDTTA